MAQKMMQNLQRYPEEKVDQMRRQKDEELEQYIKQTMRAQRFAAKANQVMGPGDGAAATGQMTKSFKVQGAAG